MRLDIGVRKLFITGLIGLSLLTLGCSRAPSSESGAAEPGKRAPGMHPEAIDTLALPVARTADLRHLTPAHIAAALGKDPAQIFAFVRDAIGYEAYSGFMRGPRGTLLALSGNSVDRAALVASLLEQAGHRVRYARGTLSERDARELVEGMWAELPFPAATPGPTPDDSVERTALEVLRGAIKRDHDLITTHFRKVRRPEARAAGVEPNQLLEEARAHYWVQYSKNGQWVDLDPSFADAAPGRTYARAEETFERLPDSLSHRLTVRIRLEEYSAGTPSTRDLLVHTARIADLAGDDLVLVHLPEDWSEAGGADGTQSTAQITSVKPVLIVGDQIVTGQPFRTGSGDAGERVRSILSGEGTRRPAAAVATAEWVEFELIGPGGVETVTREIFDVVGKARRTAGPNLSADEVQARKARAPDFDNEPTVYGIRIAAGSVHWRHLIGIKEGDAVPGSPAADPLDVSAVLSRVNNGFAAIADRLVRRLKTPKGSLLFYPAGPRILIAELNVSPTGTRVSFDLRHPNRRAAIRGATQEEARAGQRLRGVVEGTLERVLIEALTQQLPGTQDRVPVMSTSTVLELAAAEGVPIEVLTGEAGLPGADVPEDARARLREDLLRGMLAVGPTRPVLLGQRLRFAWWRIDPQSGQTIGVTDEGLHQTSTEKPTTEGGAKTQTRVIVQRDLRGPNPHVSVTIRQRHIPTGQVETTSFTEGLEAGTRSVGRIVQRLTSDPTQVVRVFENTILGP